MTQERVSLIANNFE